MFNRKRWLSFSKFYGYNNVVLFSKACWVCSYIAVGSNSAKGWFAWAPDKIVCPDFSQRFNKLLPKERGGDVFACRSTELCKLALNFTVVW